MKIDLKFVKDWAKKNLIGTKVWCPILKSYVLFNMSGVNHGLYFKSNEIKTLLFFNILTIIKNANSVIIQKEKDIKKKDVYNVFLLESKYKIDKTNYRVYIIIKELKGGKFYYDSGEIKKVSLKTKDV